MEKPAFCGSFHRKPMGVRSITFIFIDMEESGDKMAGRMEFDRWTC